MEPSIENIPLKRKPRAVSTFLKKTYELLNEPQNLTCIRWAPNGIGFIVTNQQLFSKTVLPKYFKHSNYSSFVRQLNMYNFHKIRETNSQSYFHHECFDRDNKNAMCEIKRKPEKKKRKNDQSEDDGQQNDSVPLRQRRVKQNIYEKQQSLNMISQGHVSINLIKQDHDQLIKSQKNTTRNLFSQTFYHPQQQNPNHGNNQSIQLKSTSHRDFKDQQAINHNIGSERNFLSLFDDDKLSINDQIIDRIPRFNTKELFYPSTNNLFPFISSFQPNTFGIFY